MRNKDTMKLFPGSMACLLVLLMASSPVQAGAPQVTVLGNSIDLPLASEYISDLAALNLTVVTISAQELPQHKGDPLIIILGGHHAPEGVGPIVDGLLDQKEKDELVSSSLARTVRVMPNAWAGDQNVLIFAGYDEQQTLKAFGDEEPALIRILQSNNPSQIANFSSATDHSTAASQDYSQLRVC
jgi:hypothetical protein